jgi:hypothetical protein
MNEFIEWTGGKCPIDEGSYIEAKYRSGDIGSGYAVNYDWDWMEDDAENDIVAYRVLDGVVQ